MARTLIAAVPIDSVTVNGYNLTDSVDFTTLGIGADNGVEFAYVSTHLIFLKNPLGASANFTIVLSTPTSISDVGGTVNNINVAVGAGKTHILEIETSYNDGGLVKIDCDSAAEALVVSPRGVA